MLIKNIKLQILIGIVFLIVLSLLPACASHESKVSDMTLISCINDYKKQYPNISPNLAYTYCSARFNIINNK